MGHIRFLDVDETPSAPAQDEQTLIEAFNLDDHEAFATFVTYCVEQWVRDLYSNAFREKALQDLDRATWRPARIPVLFLASLASGLPVEIVLEGLKAQARSYVATAPAKRPFRGRKAA